MQYLGGKSRICKNLSDYINKRLLPEQPYWEPFVGSGWVIAQVDSNRDRYASDIHEELIKMWKATQNGWRPPTTISQDDYYNIKNNSDDMALRGFVGFACSWGGKWWGGYARDPKSDRNYALGCANSLMRRVPLVRDVHFFCSDYRKPKPKQPTLIYCDPPYDGTTEFRDKFDSAEFFQWAREMTVAGHIVLVSEYKAPPDFTCVWQQQTKTDLGNNKGDKIHRVEKLFEYIKGNN